MRTSLYTLGVFGLCLTWAASDVAGQEAGQPAGRVLILKNDRTLEGEVRREGAQYIIRRTIGEISLPADRVLKLCADWDEAFLFVRSQANLRDPDERLRLARWCQQRNLKQHALEEASAAVQMRPKHAESLRLLKILQRPEPAPAEPTPVETVAQAPTNLQIDLSSDALALFTTRVQPILMNACANCHCNGRGGAFQLQRVSGVGATNRVATHHNLEAVLRRVDLERPAMSSLLIKAVSDHGGTGQAPIKDKRSLVYRSLEDWLGATIASNPHLKEIPELRTVTTNQSVRPIPVTPTSAILETSKAEQQGFAEKRATGDTPLPAQPVVAKVEARTVPATAIPSSTEPARPRGPVVTAPREARDEFDPDEFNRRAHPQRP
jgi:hypothetical protein